MIHSTALTEAQLMKAAPSIFATAPHHRVSDRYGFVPTIEVIRAFQQEGWFPVRAQQSRVRDLSRREHTRHMVRMRRVGDQVIQVGDALAELVLTNSHDASSAYQLDIGLFRLACLNGMVTSMGEGSSLRVRHGKNVVGDIIEGSYQLLDTVPRIAASVDRFREIELDRHEQGLFAESALEARYGEDWARKSPVEPFQLIRARRSEDARDDLWSTYNRVQENLVRGGLRGRAQSGRRVRTRPIGSVVEDVRLNRALWRLTERFAELKAA
ncbi:MAG TPA: DUF932 domain-containing protein [Thiohalobacter sp.]|nr:DUF932 domain-containing protein [Thiohalobacter sp.]